MHTVTNEVAENTESSIFDEITISIVEDAIVDSYSTTLDMSFMAH